MANPSQNPGWYGSSGYPPPYGAGANPQFGPPQPHPVNWNLASGQWTAVGHQYVHNSVPQYQQPAPPLPQPINPMVQPPPLLPHYQNPPMNMMLPPPLPGMHAGSTNGYSVGASASKQEPNPGFSYSNANDMYSYASASAAAEIYGAGGATIHAHSESHETVTPASKKKIEQNKQKSNEEPSNTENLHFSANLSADLDSIEETEDTGEVYRMPEGRTAGFTFGKPQLEPKKSALKKDPIKSAMKKAKLEVPVDSVPHEIRSRWDNGGEEEEKVAAEEVMGHHRTSSREYSSNHRASSGDHRKRRRSRERSEESRGYR